MSAEERVQKIKEVVRRQRHLYADDPNVHSIGWGLAIRGGRLQDEVAIKFFVHQKLADLEAVAALGSRVIPAEIEGFPTDVEAETLLRAGSSALGDRGEKIRNPLVGGATSANAAGHLWVWGGYGTLGMLGRDDEGRALAMSNWHVWADGGKEGDNIIQPGHPTTVDHVLSVFEVLACGPVLGAVVNTTVPSPLTLGLYGGAAAVALAAAASDRIDPTRRGQEATPVGADETTEMEEVEFEIEYPDLPWPGTPFRVRPSWTYFRHTTNGTLTHEVSEEKINPHFLVGHAISVDKAEYEATETVTARAIIWDHRWPPCDAYHVGLHLIPDNDPQRALRQMLKPAACSPDFMGRLFPTGADLCLRFDFFRHLVAHGQRSHRMEWLSITALADDEVRIGPSGAAGSALALPAAGLRFRFHPATRVRVRLLSNPEEVKLHVFDPLGQEVGAVTAPPGSDSLLEVEAPLITWAELHSEEPGTLVGEFCIAPIAQEQFTVPVDPQLGRQLLEQGSSGACTTDSAGNEICLLNIRRCCFERSFEISSLEPPDHWRGYLMVQGVNHVPAGTDPVVAATIIGGHVLTAGAEIVSCAVIHAVDVEYDTR
jgi:hypothetical protein